MLKAKLKKQEESIKEKLRPSEDDDDEHYFRKCLKDALKASKDPRRYHEWKNKQDPRIFPKI